MYYEELDDYSEYPDYIAEAMREEYDQAFEDLIDCFDIADKHTSVLNFQRLKELYVCYQLVQSVVDKSNTKISLELHKPVANMGYVEIKGKRINVTQPKKFVEICRLASNIEVLPMTDGNTVLNIGFNDITNIIEGD